MFVRTNTFTHTRTTTHILIHPLTRSNFHGPTVGTVLRWDKKHQKRVVRQAPTLIVEYNKYMGGTDLCDQRRGYYTTQRKSKKWWHSLWYFTLDILMVSACQCMLLTLTHPHPNPHTHTHTHTQLNSWSVYNSQSGTDITHKNFIVSVCKGLLREFDPDCALGTDPSSGSESEELMTPTARVTPPVSRFHCTKQEEASIARSKKYKYVTTHAHTNTHTHTSLHL